MEYILIVKQINTVKVNAFTKEQAINIVKKQLDPKALVEINIVDAGKIEEKDKV